MPFRRERERKPEGYYRWTKEQQAFYEEHGYEMPKRIRRDLGDLRPPKRKGYKPKKGLAALEPMPDIDYLRKDEPDFYDRPEERGPEMASPESHAIMQEVEKILTSQGGDVSDIIVNIAKDKWLSNRNVRYQELMDSQGADPERARSTLDEEMPWPFEKFGYFPPTDEGVEVPAIEESIYSSDDLG